jgi:hypothetical protein
MCILNLCGDPRPYPKDECQFTNRVKFMLSEVDKITISNPKLSATDTAGHVVELYIPLLRFQLKTNSTVPSAMDREGLRDWCEYLGWDDLFLHAAFEFNDGPILTPVCFRTKRNVERYCRTCSQMP